MISVETAVANDPRTAAPASESRRGEEVVTSCRPETTASAVLTQRCDSHQRRLSSSAMKAVPEAVSVSDGGPRSAAGRPPQCGAIVTESALEDEDGAIAPVSKLAIDERSLAGAQPAVHGARVVR